MNTSKRGSEGTQGNTEKITGGEEGKALLLSPPPCCGCTVIVWEDLVPEGFIKDSNPAGCVAELLLL